MFSFSGFVFHLVSHNELFVWLGLAEAKKRNRFPPIGSYSNNDLVRKLTADLSGRRARWVQLDLANFAIRYAFMIDCGEFLRLGYRLKLIKKAWLCLHRCDMIYEIGISVIDELSKQLRSQKMRPRNLPLPLMLETSVRAHCCKLSSALRHSDFGYSFIMGKGGKKGAKQNGYVPQYG